MIEYILRCSERQNVDEVFPYLGTYPDHSIDDTYITLRLGEQESLPDPPSISVVVEEEVFP